MTNEELISHLEMGGFKHAKDLIHVFLGGSNQHGAAIPGKVSDLDVYGVYIEQPTAILGVKEETHFTGSTQDQYERNRPGDEDYKCYTLKRWAGLACKGNPTILGFLYTPCTIPSVWYYNLVDNRDLFKAKSHASAFLGYAQSQVGRLCTHENIKKFEGIFGVNYTDMMKGRGKHGQRSELENKFGYDTKAAMHLIRLLYEAEEYMKTGYITYPRPEKHLLLAIRQGEWSWDRLFATYQDMEMRVKAAQEHSELPAQVDREKVSQVITDCYLEHWNNMGYLTYLF